MAYSFARSGRESYVNLRDLSPNKQENILNKSRKNEDPEYLDFGFGWLNDYDKVENHKPQENRAAGLTETVTENPYGWSALGPTRRPRRDSRELRQENRAAVLTETVTENPYGWGALGPTRRPRREYRENELRQTNKDELKETLQVKDIDETQKKIPYSSKALGSTSKSSDLRQTRGIELRQTVQSNYIGTTQRENPHRWRALGQTRRTSSRFSAREGIEPRRKVLRETIQSRISGDTQVENPYGWRALGRTRRVNSVTSDAEINGQPGGGISRSIMEEEILEENPYGWNALGPTRRPQKFSSFADEDREGIKHQPSNAVSTSRPSRKRTHRETFSKAWLNRPESRPEVVPSGKRKIKHPIRLSVVKEGLARDQSDGKATAQEEATRSTELRETLVARGALFTKDNRVFRGSFGDGAVLGTTGGDIRGTTNDYTYAYSNFIKSENETDSVILKPGSLIGPERRLTRNWPHVRPLEHTPKHWTNIAGDQDLMGKWHERFAKMKKKWAPSYRDPSFMSSRPSADTSIRRLDFVRRLRKREENSKKTRLVLISVCVIVVFLIAIIVPSVILTRSTGNGTS